MPTPLQCKELIEALETDMLERGLLEGVSDEVMPDIKRNWLQLVLDELGVKLPTIVCESVDSSNIVSVGYYDLEEVLEVEFKGGARYDYFEAPKSLFNEFIASDSKGKFFHRYVKGKYAFKRQV